MIMKMEVPGMPWFRFEWHPEKRCAYVVRLPTEKADMLLDGVMTEREARMAVHAFVAGYQQHAAEPTLYRGDGPRTYRVFLESGKFGAKGSDLK